MNRANVLFMTSLIVSAVVCVTSAAHAEGHSDASTDAASNAPAAPEQAPTKPDQHPSATVPTAPAFEHRDGFALDARLPLNFGGPFVVAAYRNAPVVLGYRGRRFGLLMGPLFDRIQTEAACGECEGSSTTYYGAQLRADVTVIRTADGRLDGYIPLAISLSGETARSEKRPNTPPPVFADFGATSGEATWGAQSGFGVRYWLTPNVGLLSEISLAYRDAPNARFRAGAGAAAYDIDVVRSRAVAVEGSVGAAFVF